MARFFTRLFARRPTVPPETRVLRQALVDWRTRADETTAEAMAVALRQATLFALMPDRGRRRPDRPIPVAGLTRVEGTRCWMVFTEPAIAHAAWREAGRPRPTVVPVAAVDVLRRAATDALAVVIDPRAEGPRLVISADRAGPIAAGLVPDGRGGWRAGPDLRFTVAVPGTAPPDGLCAALGLIARREAGVATAHLFDMIAEPGIRAAAVALTFGPTISDGGAATIRRRVEDHLSALFRDGAPPTVVVPDDAQREAVFRYAVPLFVREGFGTGIEVPDGHRVGLILPAGRPQVVELDCRVLLVDFGPTVDEMAETLRHARQRLAAEPRPVVWVLQRTAIAALDGEPVHEARLRATMGALVDLGNPLIEQTAVVSAETRAGRALAERLGELGVRVHAFGPTREVAVEIAGPETVRLGLPGRVLAEADD